jgi:hypothetical protein
VSAQSKAAAVGDAAETFSVSRESGSCPIYRRARFRDHVCRLEPSLGTWHTSTIEIVHTLQPRIVVMAGAEAFDPYKD